MAIEDELRKRLRKVEALFFGATTTSEREALGAAAERLKAKLAEASRLDPPVEMKFTMPDRWLQRSSSLSVAATGSGLSDTRVSAARRSWSRRRGAYSTRWCGGNSRTCTPIFGPTSSGRRSA